MGLFLEREPFGDIDEEPGLADYLAEVEMEVMQETLENDPVSRQFIYVRFRSDSKGRDQYGRPRKRKYPVEVELVGRGKKRFIQLKENGSGGLDRWAEEALDGLVPPDRALGEFIRRLRTLPEQQRTARGER